MVFVGEEGGGDLGRDFVLGPEMGKGRFGVVRRCRSSTTGEVYAVKSVDLTEITDPVDLESVEEEAKFISIVSGHPNVINLHAFYSSSTSLHLVLDLCSGQTLHDRINSFESPTEKQVITLFRPLMEAIGHCHRRGVVHRDVKPENILFDSKGRLRLADFGSAGDARTEKMKGLFGTPYYVAPEMVAGKEYDEKVDIWSAGVILYVMLAGILPFDGESVVEVFEKVLRGNLRFPTRVWKGVSPAAKDLVRKMLSKDVSRRFSADQVLRHPLMLKEEEEEEDYNETLVY